MGERYPNPVVLDATVVSNFASTNSVGFLADVLESPVTVPTVRDEITRGYRHGHDYLESAIDAFGDRLPVINVDRSDESSAIRDRLDAGEAEAMLGAIERNGTLATDDLAARSVADERNCPVIGSIGILVLGVEGGQLDRPTADAWLDTWRDERGYYAPVDSVSEVLEDED